MDIKDIEVLIECKRLVEKMLCEKKAILKSLERCGKDTDWTQRQIVRLERALQGKPPVIFEQWPNKLNMNYMED